MSQPRRPVHALPNGYRLHWYEIDGVLGQGGFGITYLAHDINLNQRVAIKEFLPAELAVRTEAATVQPVSGEHGEIYAWGLARFISEAQTLARFKHPNIVTVAAVFQENNTAYMVMEYVDGESFEQAARRGQLASEERLLSVVHALIGGVEQIHAAGFIHRDIKPENVYLRADGSPVLLDFGSARQAVGERTNTLTALVSPGYAPYEQYDTSSETEKQGPWTDIYALGATLYRAVTGKGPVDAMARVHGVLDGKDTLKPAAELARGRYSEAFLGAIDRALSFRPADRPQSIDEWRGLLPGVPASARPDETAEERFDSEDTVILDSRGGAEEEPEGAEAPVTDPDDEETIVRTRPVTLDSGASEASGEPAPGAEREVGEPGLAAAEPELQTKETVVVTTSSVGEPVWTEEDSARDGPDAGLAPSPDEVPLTPALPAQLRRRTRWGMAAAGAVAGGLGVALWLWLGGGPSERHEPPAAEQGADRVVQLTEDDDPEAVLEALLQEPAGEAEAEPQEQTALPGPALPPALAKLKADLETRQRVERELVATQKSERAPAEEPAEAERLREAEEAARLAEAERLREAEEAARLAEAERLREAEEAARLAEAERLREAEEAARLAEAERLREAEEAARLAEAERLREAEEAARLAEAERLREAEEAARLAEAERLREAEEAARLAEAERLREAEEAARLAEAERLREAEEAARLAEAERLREAEEAARLAEAERLREAEEAARLAEAERLREAEEAARLAEAERLREAEEAARLAEAERLREAEEAARLAEAERLREAEEAARLAEAERLREAEEAARLAEAERLREAEEAARLAEAERLREAEEAARLAEAERLREAEEAARLAEAERLRKAEEAARLAEAERLREAEEAARLAEAERLREAAATATTVGGLLADARAHIEALRLTNPPGRNAYEDLRSVLEIDPDNDDARAGLDAIVEQYLRLSSNEAEKGRFDRANAYLDRAESVRPGSESVASARQRITELRAASEREPLTVAKAKVEPAISVPAPAAELERCSPRRLQPRPANFPGVLSIMYSHPAFENAPAPKVRWAEYAYTSVINDRATERSVSRYDIVDSDAVASRVRKHHELSFDNGAGTYSFTEATTGLHIQVLGGILTPFDELQSKRAIRQVKDGVTESSSTVRETRTTLVRLYDIDGGLFPLRVGNALSFRDNLRTETDGGEPTAVPHQGAPTRYQVSGVVPGREIDSRLACRVFVLDYAIERPDYRNRGKLYFSEELGLIAKQIGDSVSTLGDGRSIARHYERKLIDFEPIN